MVEKTLDRDFFVKQGRRGGKIGARMQTPEQRRAIARKAAQARWAKKKAEK